MEQSGTPAGDELSDGELGNEELILALAAGATVRDAAEQAGIGERTVQRRLADADFRRAVSETDFGPQSAQDAEIKAERAQEHGGNRTKRNKSVQVRPRCLRALTALI